MMRINLGLLTLLMMAPSLGFAQDQAPITLTYQGSLSNAAGEAITADRPMSFRLYTLDEVPDTFWRKRFGGLRTRGS